MTQDQATTGLERALGHLGMRCDYTGVPGHMIVRGHTDGVQVNVAIRAGRDRVLRMLVTGRNLTETKEKCRDNEKAADCISRWAGVVARQALRNYARR